MTELSASRSPVEFRGVKIGEVTRIAATFNPWTLDMTIPVYPP